jgi:hypothetical protein
VGSRMPSHSRHPGGSFRTTGPPTSNLRIFLSLWPIRPGHGGFLTKVGYFSSDTSCSEVPYSLVGPDLAIDTLAGPDLAIDARRGGFSNGFRWICLVAMSRRPASRLRNISWLGLGLKTF